MTRATPSRWLLKRCVGRVGRRVDLRGDNVAASTDSRDFGLVDARDVAYIVLSAPARLRNSPR